MRDRDGLILLAILGLLFWQASKATETLPDGTADIVLKPEGWIDDDGVFHPQDYPSDS